MNHDPDASLDKPAAPFTPGVSRPDRIRVDVRERTPVPMPKAGNSHVSASTPPTLVSETLGARAESTVLRAETLSETSTEDTDITHSPATARGDSFTRAGEGDHRPNPIARGAVAQVAEAIRLPTDGSIEVRLSPEELGRVKLSMVSGEAGLVIQLVAERPETLELLRRHADLLATELHDAGFSGLEFTFSQEGDHGRGEAEQSRLSLGHASASAASAEPGPTGPMRGLAPDGGLDIRL